MKTIRRLAGGLTALAWLAEVCAAEPATDQPVGEFSDVTRVAFAGNRTFTEASIRDGLLMAPDYLLAAHSAAPLGELLATLERLTLTGYQSLGFPRAQVTSRLDGDTGRIVITVDEGPRYRRGEVKIRGAKKIPTETLRRRLVEPYPPVGLKTDAFKLDMKSAPEMRLDRFGKEIKPQDPIWEKGEPAPFAESSIQFLAGSLTNVFAELGFFYPRLTVKVAPNAGDGTADLLVDILDEGPPGVINQIEITGNQVNSREEILKYLGLTPGRAFSQDLLTECELRLWNSARFLSHKLILEPPQPGETRINLRIELVEYATLSARTPVPKLTKELSAEDKALLKLRDWLAAFPTRTDDLVASTPDLDLDKLGRFESDLIVSPRQGLLFVVRGKGSAGAQNCQWAMMMTGREIAFFSPQREQKLVMGGPHLKLNTFLSVLPGEPGSEQPFNLSIGAGFYSDFGKSESSRGQDQTPDAGIFNLDLVLAPVAFLDRAHNKDFRGSVINGVLQITNEHVVFKSEAATGRLIEWAETSEFEGTPLKVSVRAEPRAHDRLREELERATRAHRNVYQPSAPLSSTASFLIEESAPIVSGLHWLPTNLPPARLGPATAALKKLLAARVLSPVDRLLAPTAETAENFRVPPDFKAGNAAAIQQAGAMISAFVFKFSNELFPRRSWPWTLARESVFVISGKDKYTGRELERIYESPETGPIGFWATARLLKLANSPMGQAFARRGLTRLFAEDFRKDCRLLLASDSALRQSAEQMAAAWRDLPDADIEALAGVLPPAGEKFLRDTARRLRENKDKPLDEALAPVLDELWEDSLKQRVRSALRELAR